MITGRAVYSKPSKFAAYKLPKEPNLGIANMCNGQYVPAQDGVTWMLQIHPAGRHGKPGDWLMLNEDGQFFIITDENFKETYIEKVSYENQSS